MLLRLSSGFRKFTLNSNMKPQVIFVLGGPGAGKGTQCENIVKKYGFIHLSAGDLLREERSKKGSQYGEMIEEYIRGGKIVPVEVTCSLIELAMKKFDTNKFLVDGFPRNKDNLEGWQRVMGDNVDLLFVLYFDCPEKVCSKRCLDRGAAGSGRSDDNPESLIKRFQTYINDTMPIINHYEQLDLAYKVDASRTPSEVFDEVQVIFQKMKVA